MRVLLSKIFQRKNQLILILLLGLLHGLIYVFMIPPWWHHEEPGHFEYAWLLANRPGRPILGDYDNDIRRQIAEAMLSSGQENLYNVSRQNLDEDPIDLGGSPVGRKVAYYWVISLPLRLVRGQPVLFQLYLARLTSLGLFLLSIWLAWLLMRELVSEAHPLRWMMPVFLALLPGYIDNMTSVHDDVLSAVVAALFFWLSVRILKRGFTLLSLIGWLGSLWLCVVARDTTLPLALLAPVVPLALLLKKLAVPVMSAVLVVIIFFLGSQVLTIRDAAQWFYFPGQNIPSRIKDAQTPFGEYAFSLSSENGVTSSFGQSFAPDFIKPLRKKTLTLGVWIWADRPAQFSLPILNYRTPEGLVATEQQIVQIGATPAFYAITYQIPYEAGHAWLTPLPAFPEEITRVYYDGFVLAEGEFSSMPPTFGNEELRSGLWDGRPFINLARNPSAERAWLGIHLPFDLPQRYFYIAPALFLQTMQDVEGFGWYHRLAVSSLFQTFWGRGAAAQVPLAGGFSYTFLQLVSLVSVVGILLYGMRNRSIVLRPEIFLLAGALLIIWIAAFFRGTWWVFYFVPLVPYARYAFPGFIPAALLICTGLLGTLRWMQVRYGLHPSFPALAFAAFFGGLAVYAIFSFGGYFHPKLMSAGYLVLFVALIGLIFVILRNIAYTGSASPTE